MAIGWIQVDTELPHKPEVVEMASRLECDEHLVVGCLVAVWCWANKHVKRSGNARGVTFSFLDRCAHVTGFAQAMHDVGWLDKTSEGVRFPKFDRFNAQSAKERALTRERVARHRAEKCNGASVTQALPEKRREEKNTPYIPQGGPDGFSSHWEDATGAMTSDVLLTDSFREAWGRWISYRLDRGWKRYPKATLEKHISECEQAGPAVAIEMIDLAISRQYRGLSRLPAIDPPPDVSDTVRAWKEANHVD